MQEGMIKFLLSKGVHEEDAIIGYHIPPFISQKHLHLHGISPISDMSLSNRISFFMPSFWFKSVSLYWKKLFRKSLRISSYTFSVQKRTRFFASLRTLIPTLLGPDIGIYNNLKR